VAGVFFAFSTFVMDALGRAPAPEALAAMQWINRRVVTSAFMPAWLGTGVACAVVAVWSALSAGDRRAIPAIAAGALYLAGSMAVTFTANVPMNDRLDTLDARDPAAAGPWRTYVRSWTRWNHVRTAASLAAAALLTIALAE
jgi:uncharacterized membrane protein